VKNPLVSIIIPLYNQEKFVGEAIQSALSQTFRDFEVIVVDDGSTDNGSEVVSRFGGRIRNIYQENQGLAGARNTAIRAAQGELIGLLDADDQWLPDYLETMVALADRNPQAAVLFCAAQSMDETGNDLPEIFGKPPASSPDIFQTLLRANFLIPSTILMRRSISLEAGSFDSSLRSCEDWDLWLRIAPDHNFVGTPACLVRYRLHESSLTANPQGMQQAARAVIEKQFGIDDGNPSSWSPEKRRAYGGLYRYHALTSVRRLDDWETAGQYLRQALYADPLLSVDLDLFFELTYGSLSTGYKSSSHPINLEINSQDIYKMLDLIFSSAVTPESGVLRRRTYGTANYALGLVAYNLGERSQSRSFFFKALSFRPELWQDRRIIGNSLKSFLSQSALERIKQSRDQIRT
jgi:glycosyltransferase involved in cell wall biosynthesis